MNLMIAGVGGQGAVLITRLLGEAMAKADKEVLATESLGMAQRGGSVVSFLRIGEEGGPLPGEKSIDFLLALELVEGLRNLKYLKPQGKAVLYGKIIYPPGLEKRDFSLAKLNLPENIKIFPEEKIEGIIKNPKTVNVFFLGILIKNTFPELADSIIKTMEKNLNPEKYAANFQSFWQGYNYQEI